MDCIKKLQEISQTIFDKIEADISLKNSKNPLDYYGEFHNQGMHFLSERLDQIVVPEFSINTTIRVNCKQVDLHETERQIIKYVDQFLKEIKLPKPIVIPDIRPKHLTLAGIVRSNLIDIVEQIHIDGKITDIQRHVIVLYLEQSKKIFPNITSFVQMTKEFENEISFSKDIKEEEKTILYRILAIGKYSGYYAFKIQGNLDSKWNPNNGTWFPHDGDIQEINWWKTLGVDCIGGMVGGPGGYVGSSAISVIMQLG